MRKVINPGKVAIPFRKHKVNAFAEINWDGRRLSIHGVVGPQANWNCRGSCGQCVDEIETVEPNADWTPEMVKTFCSVWRRWHLNDMRAGCSHQRWLGITEVGKSCPICGYKYGHSWLTEEVPQEVIDWLQSLPDTKIEPAWV